MKRYDIILKETGQRCGTFEISSVQSDNSLKRINAMNIDFKKYETLVPSTLEPQGILKEIVYNLFPDQKVESFLVK